MFAQSLQTETSFSFNKNGTKQCAPSTNGKAITIANYLFIVPKAM